MSVSNQDLLFDEARLALARGRTREALNAAAKLVETAPKHAAAWHLLGKARQELGEHDEAVRALQKAASLDRDKAPYQHDLGNALADQGKLDQAITCYRRALHIDDANADVHNDLGAAYHQKAWFAEAESSFRRATELKPEHGIAYANLGAALRSQRRLPESRRAYQRALLLKVRAALPVWLRWKVGAASAADSGATRAEILRTAAERGLLEARKLALEAESRFPEDAEVLYVAGGVLADLGETDQAIVRMRKACALRGGRAGFHVALAKLLVRAGDAPGALHAAEQAVKLEPESAAAHAALSMALRDQHPALAENAARRAIALDPRLPEAHDNLALALAHLERIAEAEQPAREAVRLQPAAPGFRMNLAVLLKTAGAFGEARDLYRELSRNPPRNFETYLNLGTLALDCEGDLAAARSWYAKARELAADGRVELSAAVVDLLDNRFEAAWPRYEKRKQLPEQRDYHEKFAALPAWTGQTLQEESLVVYGEQGLGDEIMFASMLTDLHRRVSRITLACDRRLARLVKRSFPWLEVRDRAAPPPSDARFAIAAGSLGLHLRRDAKDFASQGRYLKADAARVANWRDELRRLAPGRKIGISWRGGLVRTGRARRSLALDQLRSLLQTPNATWISLQYGDVGAEVEAFSAATSIPVHRMGEATDDIDGLAALIDSLDLVVSVCNTTVHLAGALGKEVWVMAPFVPEWRYGLRGETMPWYPSARVFRQPAIENWDAVIATVRKELEA